MESKTKGNGAYLIPEMREFWINSTASVTETWVRLEKYKAIVTLRLRLVRIAGALGFVRGLPLHAQKYLLKYATDQTELLPDGNVATWIDGVETVLIMGDGGFVVDSTQRPRG